MVTKGMKPSIKIRKTGPMASFLFVCVLLSIGLFGCTERPINDNQKPKRLVYNGTTMGTSYQVKIAPSNTLITIDLAEQINSRLESLDNTFTTYQKTSELMLFNQAELKQPTIISDDMQRVMRLASEIYVQTNSTFDPTVGPLVNLWGFGPKYTGDQIPNPQEIGQHLESMSLDHLSLDRNAKTASRNTDIQLDFSAIAKGYAVDAIAELLIASGIENYLVEVGGELRASGRKHNGDFWRIAIETPSLSQGGIQQVVDLENVAVATSGDYRNYFEKNGKRYSHTIDPRTGYPVDHKLASVTVIAATAAKADALATAMMVMGPEQTLLFAEQHGIPVYILVKQAEGFEAQYSQAFSDYLSE
jgi:FAD:protein FMN transferase